MMKKDLLKKVGIEIQKARREKKMTQEEAAEKFEISTSHFAAIEHGRRGMSLDAAVTIAEYFNLSLDDMFLNKESSAKCKKQSKCIIRKRCSEKLCESEDYCSLNNIIIECAIQNNGSLEEIARYAEYISKCKIN